MMLNEINLKNPICIFDSGLGGLTVAADLHKLLPNENIIYFGDSKNAPYGIKNKNEIIKLSENIINFFINLNAKAIIIACNTATSAAANELRTRYPQLPIIGMEPALKPAVKQTTNGDILVLATPYTINHAKYKTLVDELKSQLKPNQNIFSISAPNLVEFVENNNFNETKIHNYISSILPKKHNITAVVLGCTHFLHLKSQISSYFDTKVTLFDGNLGTINHLKDLINLENNKGKVQIINSKSKALEILSKNLFEDYLNQ